MYPKQDNNIHMTHTQYQGCWWLGDARSRGISSHGINIVCLEYFGASAEGFKEPALIKYNVYGLMQKRHNTIVYAIAFCLFCDGPLIYALQLYLLYKPINSDNWVIPDNKNPQMVMN